MLIRYLCFDLSPAAARRFPCGKAHLEMRTLMSIRPFFLAAVSTAGAYIAGYIKVVAPYSPRLHAPARCTIPVGCAQPDGEHASLPHAQRPIESEGSD